RVELEEVVVRMTEYGRQHARDGQVGAREGGTDEVVSGGRGAREFGQNVLEEGYRALFGILGPVVLGSKVVRQRLDAELLELADEREARVRREHLARERLPRTHLRALRRLLGHERRLRDRLLEPLERPVRIAYDLAVGEQHRRGGDAGRTPMLGFSRDRNERAARMSHVLVLERPPQPLRERGAVELDPLQVRHATTLAAALPYVNAAAPGAVARGLRGAASQGHRAARRHAAPTRDGRRDRRRVRRRPPRAG